MTLPPPMCSANRGEEHDRSFLETRPEILSNSFFALPKELPAASQSPQKPNPVQFLKLQRQFMPSPREHLGQMMRRDRSALAFGEPCVAHRSQHAPSPGAVGRQSLRQRSPAQRPCGSVRFTHMRGYTDGTDDIMSVAIILRCRLIQARIRSTVRGALTE